MPYEWDPEKGRTNLRKHGVRFADAVAVFADQRALMLMDSAVGEERWMGRMKREYDFGAVRRGALDPVPPGKTRITIRLDDDVLEWFRTQVEVAGGGNYQSLINAALREYVARVEEPLEETLRRVVREELDRSG